MGRSGGIITRVLLPIVNLTPDKASLVGSNGVISSGFDAVISLEKMVVERSHFHPSCDEAQ